MYNSYGNVLSSNHCAAVSFYGNPFGNASGGGSGSGSGNGISDSVLKALTTLGQTINTTNNINKNDKLIDKYNLEKTSVVNTLGTLGNIKSKLADLSTKAMKLKNLQETISVDFSANQANSLLKNSNISLSGLNASLKNVSGNLTNGLYNVNIDWASGSSASKLTSTNGILSNSRITKTELLNTRFSDIEGYTGLSSGDEIITITNGANSGTVTLDENTTVCDFINAVNNLNLGVTAGYDATRGSVGFTVTSNDTDIFSLSSSSVSEGDGMNALRVLGIENVSQTITSVQTTEVTLNLTRPTTFGDIGYDGTITRNASNNRYVEISSDATYGDTLVGTMYKDYNQVTGNFDITFNEDKMTIVSANPDVVCNCAPSYIDFSSSLTMGYSTNDTDILNSYDLSNIKITADIDISKLDNKFGTYGMFYYDYKTYKLQSGTTYKEALISLGVITQEEIDNSETGYISVDVTGVMKTSYSFANVVSTYTLEAQAKTDENKPITLYDNETEQITDKLVTLSNGSDLISTGTFVLTENGNNVTFTIDENTTLADFNKFLTDNGVIINDDGSYDFGTKTISGTSNLVDAFDIEIVTPQVSEYTGEAQDDGARRKNLSAFGLGQSGYMSVNGVQIELLTNDGVGNLVNKINNANAGVTADFNIETGQITLTSNNQFKAIEIQGDGTNKTNTFLNSLGFLDENGNSVSQQEHNIIVTIEHNGNTKTKTITADASGNLVFNYSQENDGETAAAQFNITDLGNFTFGVSNTEQDILNTNLKVAQILSYSDNLEANTYTINVNEDKTNLTLIDKDGNTSNHILTQSYNGNTYFTLEQDNGENIILQIKDTGMTTLNITVDKVDLSSLSGVVNSVNATSAQNNISYVRDFVSAYNDVVKEINTLERKEYRDFYSLVNQMKAAITTSDDKNSTDFGLNMKYDTIDKYTNLLLDETELLNDLENDFENLSSYLSSMSDTLVSKIDTFITGRKYQSAYNKTMDEIEKYEDTISKIKNQNEVLMSDYEAQYKIFQQIWAECMSQYQNTAYV